MTREDFVKSFTRDQRVRLQERSLICYLDKWAEETLGIIPNPWDQILLTLQQTDTIPAEDFFLKILPRLRKEPHFELWGENDIAKYFRNNISHQTQ